MALYMVMPTRSVALPLCCSASNSIIVNYNCLLVCLSVVCLFVCLSVCLFQLWFSIPVNDYGHFGTLSPKSGCHDIQNVLQM